MEKEFIPYDESRKLKFLGFDEPCLYPYLTLTKQIDSVYVNYKNWNEDSDLISAPLYQQAFRWFRDKHNLVGSISDRGHINGKPYYLIMINGNIDFLATSYPTYEEAQLECLRKLIETLINKK